MTPHQQQQIDFTRAEKLHLIRRARIPPATFYEGRQRRNVRPADLKGLLRAIDDFAGRNPRCWPTIQTLAQATGLSQRDVRRTLKGLQQHDLLAVEPRGRTNTYAIVWGELHRLCTPEECGPTIAAQGRATAAQIETTAAQNEPIVAQVGRQNREALKAPPPTPQTPAPDPEAAPGPDSGVGGESLQALETKPAPAPAATPDTPAAPDPQWSRVEASLRENGVKFSGRLVRRAQLRGLTPADVADAIATYRANRHKFASAGALAVWIDEGAWPADDVRTPAEIQAAAQRRNQAIEAKRDHLREARRRKAEAAKERKQLAELRKAYAPQLEAMAQDELDELARQTLTQGQYRAWQTRPQSMQDTLLLALRDQTEPMPTKGTPHG